MIRLLCCLAVIGVTSAAELTLPDDPAQRHLVVHADGARLVCDLQVPTGEHRLVIPESWPGSITVSGVSWRVHSETVVAAPADEPAGFAEVLAERNRVVVALSEWEARQKAHRSLLAMLEQRLAGVDTTAEVAQAQAAITSAMTEQAALTAQAVRLRHERLVVEQRAADLADGNPQWLYFVEDNWQPLGHDAALQLWRGRQIQSRLQRVVTVQSTVPTTAQITIGVPVTWGAAAQLAIRGKAVRLIRQVRLRKPVDLDLGTIDVEVVSYPFDPPFVGPTVPGIRIGAESVDHDKRRSVGSSLRETLSSVAQARAPQTSSEAVSTESGALFAKEKDSIPAEPVRALAASVTAEPGHGICWSIGTIALPRGLLAVEHDLPAVELEVALDEWTLMPAISPVAFRRVVMQVDSQPLLAGPLSVVVDGVSVGTTQQSALPGGGRLEVRADEDASIFALAAIPWAVPAKDMTETRRREGSTTTIHNLGATVKTVVIYATVPVSASADLSVELDPDTTPGSQESAEGVRRWIMDIPARTRRDFALGWILAAKGGLKL